MGVGGGEGGGACAHEYIPRHPAPNGCSYCVSRNDLVSVAWKGLLLACRDTSHHFFQNTWGLAVL